MKKSIITLVLIIGVVGANSSFYNLGADKKFAKATEYSVEIKNDEKNLNNYLPGTQNDFVSDHQKFKKEIEMKIKNNEKCIADLKIKQSIMNENEKLASQHIIIDLEQTNIELKNFEALNEKITNNLNLKENEYNRNKRKLE